MAVKKPVLIILAGGNGVGKSTFAQNSQILDLGFAYLNPDFVQRVYNLNAHGAGRKIIEFVEQRLADRVGRFALETTLSSQQSLNIIALAKKLDWEVQLIYLGVGSVDIQLERIRGRVAKGGHDIPEATVRRRYDRSLERLREAATMVDAVTVFDNGDVKLLPLFSLRNGKLKWETVDLPEWAAAVLKLLR